MVAGSGLILIEIDEIREHEIERNGDKLKFEVRWLISIGHYES